MRRRLHWGKVVVLAGWLALPTLGCAGDAGDGSGQTAEDTGKADHPGSGPTDLNPGERHAVLALLTERCADAWCAGDYVYFFKRISCDFGRKSCTLSLRVVSPESRSFLRTCRATGLSRASDLLQTLPNGYQDLTNQLFAEVSRCVESIRKGIAEAP